MNGEERTFTYEERAFTESGGPDSLPRLWATRKIGHLLREVRLDGPNDELHRPDRAPVDPLRHRHPVHLLPGDRGRSLRRGARCAGSRTMPSSTPLPPPPPPPVRRRSTRPTPKAAWRAATRRRPSAPSTTTWCARRGSRAFRLGDGIWTDTAFDPAKATTKVPFLSEAYFALAAVHPDLAAALGVAERVIVVWEGVAYEVVGADEAGDDFVVPPATTTTAAARRGLRPAVGARRRRGRRPARRGHRRPRRRRRARGPGRHGAAGAPAPDVRRPLKPSSARRRPSGEAGGARYRGRVGHRSGA